MYTPGSIALWDEQDEIRKAEFHELLQQPTIAQRVRDKVNAVVPHDDPRRLMIVWRVGELIQLGWDEQDPSLITKARFLDEYQQKRAAANCGYRAAIAAAPRVLGELVYYIQIRDTIKIGFTRGDPERRRQNLAGDRVLAVEPGSTKLEALRHNQFAAYRANIPGTRERFHPSDEIMDHILEIREQYADIQVR